MGKNETDLFWDHEVVDLNVEKKGGESEKEPEKCTFCEIISGQTPASIIHQDESSIAIVSLEGHPLVIPKEHVSTEDIINGQKTSSVFKAMELAVKIIPAVRKTINADGINLFSALGEAAGQEINHFHVHLIPRQTGDKSIRLRQLERHSREELDNIAANIKSNLLSTL